MKHYAQYFSLILLLMRNVHLRPSQYLVKKKPYVFYNRWQKDIELPFRCAWFNVAWKKRLKIHPVSVYVKSELRMRLLLQTLLGTISFTPYVLEQTEIIQSRKKDIQAVLKKYFSLKRNISFHERGGPLLKRFFTALPLGVHVWILYSVEYCTLCSCLHRTTQ